MTSQIFDSCYIFCLYALHNFIALTADISVGLFIVDFEIELAR